MKHFRALCSHCSFVVLAALAMPGSAGATIIYSNLPSTSTGGGAVGQANWLANSFTTGGSSSTLSDVILGLEAVSTTGTLTVSLYSSSSNAPGGSPTTIGTINDNSSSLSTSSFSDVTFTPTGTITLAANTMYFIVLSGTSATGADADWQRAANLSGTGVANQYYGSTSNSGTTWATSQDFNIDHPPYVMQVDVSSATPEPGTLFGALGGLAALLATRLRRR